MTPYKKKPRLPQYKKDIIAIIGMVLFLLFLAAAFIIWRAVRQGP